MSQSNRKCFTKEEREILAENKYVRYVSRTTVSFTEEFYGLFLEKFGEGMSSADILRACGIAPEILGKSRISSLRSRMNSMGEKGKESGVSEGVSSRNERDILRRIGLLEKDIEIKNTELRHLRQLLREKKGIYNEFVKKYE